MKRRRYVDVVATVLGLALFGSVQAGARTPGVTLEITARTAAMGGKPIAEVGAYEQLSAIAHLSIDPKSLANRGIVDLERAPRAADGLVHYDVDVQILRPHEVAKAGRVLVYDVVNRGNKTITAMASGAGWNADAMPVLLMQRGYTIVWSGWQGDILSNKLIGARFPVATDHGHPITERIATETIFDSPVGDRMVLPYAAASLDQADTQLTVRQRSDERERIIAPGDWHFVDDRHVLLKRPADMDAGAIYRFAYVARDPTVMGLGFAAVRDLIAFLRHGTAKQGNPLADLAAAECVRDLHHACANPAGGAFSSAVAFGGSQSARYLRDFLWQGFNGDLNAGRVFDGMLALIPGGRRTFTNQRFAEPGRFSRQHEDHDVPGFDFPFAYGTLRDPVTGRVDGILARCQKDRTCPKLFHVDTSAEFWQAAASLVGTGGTERDVDFPANIRAYMIAGGAHATGMVTAACESPANPLNYTPLVRALLIDLIDWSTGAQQPPDTRWPRVAAGELLAPSTLRAPELGANATRWPSVVNRPQSPSTMRSWPVLVPRIDADGNDVPGIHMPELAAPDGTYLGWNLRKPGFGAGDLCLVFGAYVPLARDAASRGSDSRLSLAERYGAATRDERVRAAAGELQRDRLLLPADAAGYVGVAAPVFSAPMPEKPMQ